MEFYFFMYYHQEICTQASGLGKRPNIFAAKLEYQFFLNVYVVLCISTKCNEHLIIPRLIPRSFWRLVYQSRYPKYFSKIFHEQKRYVSVIRPKIHFCACDAFQQLKTFKNIQMSNREHWSNQKKSILFHFKIFFCS